MSLIIIIAQGRLKMRGLKIYSLCIWISLHLVQLMFSVKSWLPSHSTRDSFVIYLRVVVYFLWEFKFPAD